jgi:hypothetical protein
MGSIDLDGVVMSFAQQIELLSGDVRLWIDGRVERGAILLLKKHIKDGTQGWVCERVPTDKPVFVPEYDVGRKLTDMEVLAWAAKAPE